MTWSIAGVVESAVKTLLRPLEDAGKILFDAANYVADWEADLLAAEEAERDAWEANELFDNKAATIPGFIDIRCCGTGGSGYSPETSVDPVECVPVGHPNTPGEEGPDGAAASQRAPSGQPPADWADFMRRIVREEIDTLLSSVVSDEVTAESPESVPSTDSGHLNYPTRVDWLPIADQIAFELNAWEYNIGPSMQTRFVTSPAAANQLIDEISAALVDRIRHSKK